MLKHIKYEDLPAGVRRLTKAAAKRRTKEARARNPSWLMPPDEEKVHAVSAKRLASSLDKLSSLQLNLLVDKLAIKGRRVRCLSRMRADTIAWVTAMHERMGSNVFTRALE